MYWVFSIGIGKADYVFSVDVLKAVQSLPSRQSMVTKFVFQLVWKMIIMVMFTNAIV